METKRVKVKTPIGIFKGVVSTAHNYGNESQPDWYIEFYNDSDGKPIYLKQIIDSQSLGGEITVEFE